MNYKIGKFKPPQKYQFKKGISGNPLGAKLHDQIKNSLKRELLAEYKRLVVTIMNSTEEQIENRIKDPKISVLELIMCKKSLRIMRDGNIVEFNKMISMARID